MQEEYNRLVKGLFNGGGEQQQNKIVVSEKELMQHPLLEQDVLKEAVPGTIRKAEHFLSFLRRVLVCLREKLNTEGKV